MQLTEAVGLISAIVVDHSFDLKKVISYSQPYVVYCFLIQSPEGVGIYAKSLLDGQRISWVQ